MRVHIEGRLQWGAVTVGVPAPVNPAQSGAISRNSPQLAGGACSISGGSLSQSTHLAACHSSAGRFNFPHIVSGNRAILPVLVFIISWVFISITSLWLSE
jgi:hypothetical protein